MEPPADLDIKRSGAEETGTGEHDGEQRGLVQMKESE